MPQKQLKNKPLVEAILEIQWKLVAKSLGQEADPHYKLLLGRLFDRVRSEYPAHEQLPTANFPDELVGHMVQHRFRVAEGKWPLVQVGPGVFAVNSTADYTWTDFRPRVVSALQKLYDAHPQVDDLEVTKAILRYIDAVEFDYSNENALTFLQEKLKLHTSLPRDLFGKSGVEERPLSLTWQASFRCGAPKGVVNLRFATGQKNGARAIIWETTVQSDDDDVPDIPHGFEPWLDAAHSISREWFFRLIEGELERRFSGD